MLGRSRVRSQRQSPRDCWLMGIPYATQTTSMAGHEIGLLQRSGEHSARTLANTEVRLRKSLTCGLPTLSARDSWLCIFEHHPIGSGTTTPNVYRDEAFSGMGRSTLPGNCDLAEYTRQNRPRTSIDILNESNSFGISIAPPQRAADPRRS